MKTAIDLDGLNAEETVFVHAFLDHLLFYGSVCCTDFPDIAPDRFNELAEAIITEMNKPELH